jgi:hypothetical protein
VAGDPYRESPPDPYLLAWARIRRTEKMATLCIVAPLVIVLCLFFAFWATILPSPPLSLAIAALLILGPIAWGQIRARIRCPHCAGRLHPDGRRNADREGFRSACAVCGIPYGASKSDAEKYPRGRGE